MEFLWGGILIILLLAVLWASRDRGTKVEEKGLESYKKGEEDWTLDSVDDASSGE